MAILNFAKKRCSAQGKRWDFSQVLKEDILVIYRFKSLDVSQIRMKIDLLPIKIQIAAILDFFSLKKPQKLQIASELYSALKIVWKWCITLKYMSNSSGITTSTWRLAAILNFVKKRMFRSGETLGLFTGNKEGHSEHFLKFSALYYFFPILNLKFLDYEQVMLWSFALLLSCFKTW